MRPIRKARIISIFVILSAGLLVCWAVFTMSGPKQSDASTWKPFTLGGAEVLFPAKPNEHASNNIVEGGISDVKMLALERLGLGYALSCAVYPEEDFDAYTDEEMNAIVTNIVEDFAFKSGTGGRVIDTHTSDVQGVFAKDALIYTRIEDVNVSIYLRVLIHGDSVYKATVSTYGTLDPDKMWTRAYPFITNIALR